MKTMASFFFSPFISFLIALIDPEHVPEYKYPHCGWGLILSHSVIRVLFFYRPKVTAHKVSEDVDWRGDDTPRVGLSLWWRGPKSRL